LIFVYIPSSVITNDWHLPIGNFSLAKNSYNTNSRYRSTPLPLMQRMAPEIFFGREQVVSDMASSTASEEQIKLALLGGAGIGKTSVALHVLPHHLVVECYGDCRYFVCCDAVTSSETLEELILHCLQMPPVDGKNVFKTLHQTLSNANLNK
jgi:hypothetical protein